MIKEKWLEVKAKVVAKLKAVKVKVAIIKLEVAFVIEDIQKFLSKILNKVK